MGYERSELDSEEGIYTAEDVYGATSDFWGGVDLHDEESDAVLSPAAEAVEANEHSAKSHNRT